MEFDFSQNTVVEDINKIPQDFRGLYVNKDGKFTLDAENVGVKSAVAAITGLNTALKAARAEAKARPAAVDLTPLKEYGEDPASIATKITETLEGLRGQIKGVNIEKIKADLAGEWSTKHTAAENRAKAFETQLYQELVESRATAALAGEKGNVTLLLPFVTKQVKATVGKDGKYIVNVVDGAGDIRYSGVTGAPMSIGELVKELKADKQYSPCFESEAPTGSGVKPGVTNQPVVKKPGESGELSATAKIAKGLSAGLAKKA